MIGLIRKSAFFYITHLCTFSLIGFVPSLQGKFGVIIAMAAILPLWMTSSVLWAERTESYRFLRTLPITGAEVVTVKLAIILGAGLGYLGVFCTYILIAGERAGRFEVNLATALFSCSVCVLLGLLWQLCIWRFGIRVLTPVLGVSAALLFLLVMLPLVSLSQRPGLVGSNELWLFQSLSHPIWLGLFLVFSGLLYCGVWKIAIPVFERNDPD